MIVNFVVSVYFKFQFLIWTLSICKLVPVVNPLHVWMGVLLSSYNSRNPFHMNGLGCSCMSCFVGEEVRSCGLIKESFQAVSEPANNLWRQMRDGDVSLFTMQDPYILHRAMKISFRDSFRKNLSSHSKT
ncbi:hypothetical protein ACJIZ3_024430 [Penstemon smallii]|uniref:Uncharacterized protein n=1 Tax=Penstemon smallii TaxID=265156 RepID=A0ABD3TRS3_9LAMI